MKQHTTRSLWWNVSAALFLSGLISRMHAASPPQTAPRPADLRGLKDAYSAPWLPPAPVLSSPQLQRNPAQGSPSEVWQRVGSGGLSRSPDLAEVSRARMLGAPVPSGGGQAIAHKEQEVLGGMLEVYAREGGSFNPDNLSLLEGYLARFGRSSLRPTLLLEKGFLCRRHGRFVEALDAFGQVWQENKGRSDADGQRLAQKGLEQLLLVTGQLGQKERLAALVNEVASAELGGATAEALFKARETLWFLNQRAEQNVFCGFTAVNAVCVPLGYRPIFPDVHGEAEKRAFIRDGISLLELRAHSQEAGGKLRVLKKSRQAPLTVPCVIHWSFNHYSAVTEREEGRYRIQDPHLQFDGWVEGGALEEQLSGYVLVPGNGSVPEGYTEVSDVEAGSVFGRHCVHARDDEGDDCARGGDSAECAMATYSFRLLNPGLLVADTPIQHVPAYGPAVKVRLLYDQRSTVVADRNADYGNFGPQWTHAFHAYIVKDGTGALNMPNSSVRVVRGGGAFYRYSHITGTQQYARLKFADRPELTFLPAPAGGPPGCRGYKLVHPDGTEELFTRTDGLAESRYFLTKITDRWGRSLSLQYDSSLRLVKISDALNGLTTFGYSTNAGEDPFKIRSITDPFSRKATFNYDSAGRLRKITDPMGIASEFRYSRNDAVDQIVTPYGATVFRSGELPGVNQEPGRFIEAVDPYGDRERVEANDLAFEGRFDSGELAMVDAETGGRRPPEIISVAGQSVPFMPKIENLHYRNTFYWDRKQMAYHAGDYTKATIFNWLVSSENTITAVPASIKKPLEGRVWFNYPGQTSAHGIGRSASPSKTVRAVETAGGGVLWTMEQTLFEEPSTPPKVTYTQGMPVGSIDPEGRKLRYRYDPAQGDFLGIDVEDGVSRKALFSLGSYFNHLPRTVLDGSGLSHTFASNSSGQLTQSSTLRGPTSEVSRFVYKRSPAQDAFLSGPGDGEGYLMRIEKSLPDGRFVTVAEFTYDAAMRIRRSKDSNGLVLRHDYDSFDRLTLLTYPDNTTEQFVYDRLDLHAFKDRSGVWTRAFHNAIRKPVVLQDGRGRLTVLEWCKCGELSRLTDPMGGTTFWRRDIQGRIIEKILPDGSSVARLDYQPLSGWVASVTGPGSGLGQQSRIQKLVYSYSPSGRIVREDYSDPATPDVEYRYADVLGRRSGHSDGFGAWEYRYRPFGQGTAGAGQLEAVDGPRADDTVRYVYDWRNRLSRTELLSDTGAVLRSEETQFDSLGRPVRVQNELGRFDQVYDPLNNGPRINRITGPQGLLTELSYHAAAAASGQAGLLAGVTHSKAGAPLSSFSYGYDRSGRIQSWAQNQGETARNQFFEYSRASELIGVQQRSSAGQPQGTVRYAYDGNGNRALQGAPGEGQFSRFNSLNQLERLGGRGLVLVDGTVSEPSEVSVNGLRTETVQIPGTELWRFERQVMAEEGENTVKILAKDARKNVREDEWRFVLGPVTQSFKYDPSGNLISDGISTLFWDAANRLVGAEVQGVVYRWEYDAFGRRTAEFRDSVRAREWIWDGFELIQERDGSGRVTRNYYLRGELRDGVPLYYTRDHLGSVREMVDASGSVRARYGYDAWGARQKLEGDLDAAMGYTGFYTHAELGWVMAPLRQYDPAYGRWRSMDPIGEAGGLNLYGYLGDDPLNSVDPLGLADGLSIAWGTPAQSQVFIAPNGKRFLAPAGTDFNQIFRAGRANGLDPFGIGRAVGHYGCFDFQRNRGSGMCGSENVFYPGFTDASNYAVGVYMKGVGFGELPTRVIAGTFAWLSSKNAGSPRQSSWWSSGNRAAGSGGNANGISFRYDPAPRP
jgi:RHS repeat-associated protein